MNVGQVISTNAALNPNRVGARDLTRSLSFGEWNERSCRLGNALLGLGLGKGDRVAILAYNCLEWLEIYVALAKAGLLAVPINFRLVGPEIRHILEDSGARALIVQEALVERVGGAVSQLPALAGRCILLGPAGAATGYRAYEDLISAASAAEPAISVRPEDGWAVMYTSGTTGKPKGAVQSHRSGTLIALISALDFGFTRHDTALLVMPMCHANSLYFFATFAHCGATCCVYDRARFDPEELIRTLAEVRPTFTSLVPTHYILMLGLPAPVRAHAGLESVTRLLISSASARLDTKQGIMESFPNSRLFELYGSSEAGWVTLLRPDEQLTKLGSVGREMTGSGRIRLLDERGSEVADGEVGELYSRTPYTFDGYIGLPEQTALAFRDGHCTVGDLARRDGDGHYHLVDRKLNMIVSGGENVYPSEVESVLGAHPKVQDVAVIGIPHDTWGEAVHAVVVLGEQQKTTERELMDWSRGRIAGYKRPRSIAFVREEDMPRTATGKILHRTLRERFMKFTGADGARPR